MQNDSDGTKTLPRKQSSLADVNLLELLRLHLLAWLVPAGLALVVVLVYWPAVGHPFVNYDDDLYVTSNVRVQTGLSWENIKWVFSTPVCCNWHPVTMMSHMLDCQIYGQQSWGHHLTNVILHGLNTALVFVLLRRLTGALWRSALVAVLFGLHPLHVESVAWVAERKDVLSTFFGLLVLLFYARYAQKENASGNPSETGVHLFAPFTSGNYWLAWLFCMLGLLSKPMLVTWPFVLLLLDFWPLNRFERGAWGRLVFEKAPFFILAIVISGLTLYVQGHEGSVQAVADLPLGARYESALISYWRYFVNMIWPVNLSVFYPHPGYWPLWEVLLAGLFVCGVTAFFYLNRQRFPFLLMGWFWYLGTLVPVIGLVQVGEQAMADRYTYIPLLGVFILIVWGLHALAKKPDAQRFLQMTAGAALLALTGLTVWQIEFWRNSETLFRHALEVTERNDNAHANLGLALADQGLLDEAIEHHLESIRIRPDEARYHGNLGVAYARKGQLDDAIKEYREALRLRPDFAAGYNNLGCALDAQGQPDEAMRQYDEAIHLQPDFAGAYYNLGRSYFQKSRLDDATAQFQKAIQYEPNYAQAYNNLGIVYAMQNRQEEAVRQFQTAISLHPDYLEARNNLGITYLKMGRMDDAIAEFQSVLRIKPDDAQAIAYLTRIMDLKNTPAIK